MTRDEAREVITAALKLKLERVTAPTLEEKAEKQRYLREAISVMGSPQDAFTGTYLAELLGPGTSPEVDEALDTWEAT